MNTNEATTAAANDEKHEYVNDQVLAERTSISSSAWQTMRARRQGPPYYKVGRRCLYRWAEVVSWLESRRTEPKAS